MKDLYNEGEVIKLADEVTKSVAEKCKEMICDASYDTMSSYLYEHYTNNKEKIEGELIASITEEYVKNPTEYKYAKLRKKMWDEHKKEMTEVLTDEAIKESVEKVIMDYTHRDYHFEWQWKDAIARIILERWDVFKDDKRINDAFGRERDSLQSEVRYLKERLAEIGELAD